MPRFVHNCPDCVFLGQHGDGILFPHTDLYICTQKGLPGKILIARYSNESYVSCWVKVEGGEVRGCPALIAAYDLALAAGLLK